jgi:hypothetical protein
MATVTIKSGSSTGIGKGRTRIICEHGLPLNRAFRAGRFSFTHVEALLVAL